MSENSVFNRADLEECLKISWWELFKLKFHRMRYVVHDDGPKLYSSYKYMGGKVYWYD